MVLEDTGQDPRITWHSLPSLSLIWPFCGTSVVAVLALSPMEAHLSSSRLLRPQWAWYGEDPV